MVLKERNGVEGTNNIVISVHRFSGALYRSGPRNVENGHDWSRRQRDLFGGLRRKIRPGQAVKSVGKRCSDVAAMLSP
jgi:hypothetical protein